MFFIRSPNQQDLSWFLDMQGLMDGYSPITKTHIGSAGMSLAALCEATMFMSDNTAANFILDEIGGPTALNVFIRSIGDKSTRLDRLETDLNEAIPNDIRDTTTPNAMAMTMKKIVLEDILLPGSRQKITGWLLNNQISSALFRAGVPKDWKIADKTESGGHGSRSIAAVMWPPGRAPVIATVYITETKASFNERNAAIARIGKAIAKEILTQ